MIPAGTAAIRSGTKSCRGGAPAEPGVVRDLGTEAGRADEASEVRPDTVATPAGGETVKGKVPPAGPDVTAATLAGTANPNPVRVRHVTAVAATSWAVRRRHKNSTMYKTI